MKKTVYFVRHGETVFNTQSLIQDGTSVLSELGIEQTKRIARRFETVAIDVILASPMIRALKTAEAIQRITKASLIEDEALIEKKAPSSQVGKYIHDHRVAVERAEMLAHQTDPSWHFEDEENFYDVRARAQKVLSMLEDRSEASLAVVSHGVFIKYLLGVMWSRDLEPAEYTRFYHTFMLSNTGLTMCAYDPDDPQYTGWRILTWNDHAHLAEPVGEHTSPKTP